MTQTNSPSPDAALSPRDPAADTDPLLHLHKMSTTAGVGTGDYVAVNVTSVVAVVFGLASLLAIANSVLLVFPIVGVILGIVALRQIVNSNGTQTGKALAILGLILSGIITASIFTLQGLEVLHRRADQEALANLSEKYGQLISQDKFDEAYDLFDAGFKDRVSKQAFIVHLTSIQHNTELPSIDAITWNGLAEFHPGDEGSQTADAVIKVHFKGMEGEERLSARFHQLKGGPWLINNIPDQFPAIKNGSQAQ
jgi:hypothetical protein